MRTERLAKIKKIAALAFLWAILAATPYGWMASAFAVIVLIGLPVITFTEWLFEFAADAEPIRWSRRRAILWLQFLSFFGSAILCAWFILSFVLSP